MSGSPEQGTYQALPLTAHNERSTSERPQSGLQVEKRIARSPEFRHSVKRWRWEIFTFFLGTAAFATILALLLQSRNKPPQEWNLNEVQFQVPAIIAALAQVAQSAFLVPISYCIGQLKWEWFQRSKETVDIDRFDLASRGPDGSIRLLFHLAWRPRLVSLGCLATILMLILPTFIQASVRIGQKEVELQDDGHAIIRRSTNIFMDPSQRAKIFVAADNDTASPIEIDTNLNTALRAGFAWSPFGTTLSAYCAAGSTSAKCSWAPFKTLALCSSVEDISKDIRRDSDNVTLAALQDFLPSAEGPPLFRSISYLYMKESQTVQVTQYPSQFLPKTSFSNDTNLPNLAEVYYLYYDGCIDRHSGFNKTDPQRWKAFKGRLQFCLQTVEANFETSTKSTIVASEANIEWYETTKFNETAFCTKVESEKEDFCVSESVMESLSIQLNSIFNVTMFFNPSSRETITYNSEWGPILTHDIFGDSRETTAVCDVKRGRSGGQNPNPFELVGLYGFEMRIQNVANSLTNAFRTDHLSQDVLGRYTFQQSAVLVDFRWLILPAILYLIITAFFIATVFTTRYTPMWKSSPLPLLYAMNSEDNDGSGDQIRKDAKESWMRLRRTTTGWQMIDTTDVR